MKVSGAWMKGGYVAWDSLTEIIDHLKMARIRQSALFHAELRNSL